MRHEAATDVGMPDVVLDVEAALRATGELPPRGECIACAKQGVRAAFPWMGPGQGRQHAAEPRLTGVLQSFAWGALHPDRQRAASPQRKKKNPAQQAQSGIDQNRATSMMA